MGDSDQQLPEKVGNDGRIRCAEPSARVMINAYAMDLGTAVERVFQHELRFYGYREDTNRDVSGTKTTTKELEKGPRNDESKETRRELLWALFQQLIEQHKDLFQDDSRCYVYDCAILMYSMRQLIPQGESRELSLQVNRDALPERCRSYIRRIERFDARLLATDQIPVRNAQVTAPGEDRSLCHFLELLTTQTIFHRNNHFVFGNRAYHKDSVVPLQGVPHILKEGLQKNVRFVVDESTSSSAILQLDAKKSAFFPNEELLNFLVNSVECRDPRDLERSIWTRGNLERIQKQVKNLVLITTHMREDQVTFVCQKLTERSAIETQFEYNGAQISVADYYAQRYDIQLRYPRLPCAIQGLPPRQSYYPIELLNIVEGQRVPIEKQTPKLTEQMIRQCQILPIALGNEIERQREAAIVASGNPYYRAHGVRVNAELLRAQAQVLFPPALEYQPNDRVEPNQRGNLDWKMSGRDVPAQRQYTVPCQFPERWVAAIVQNAVPPNDCTEFCNQLVNLAQQRGIQNIRNPTRWEMFERADREFVHEKLSYYARNNCTFVLFFAPGKQNAHSGDAHHVFKLMEVETGVLTQHVSPKIMDKGIGQKGAIMVLDNILMKMNLKLGGVNYHLTTARHFKQANRDQHDVVAEEWLGKKRMFFGIELSHAPPQTLFERKAGKAPAIPTVVGMAYTVDKYMLRQRGTYWMQQARLVTINRPEQMQPMIKAVKNAVAAYHAMNGFHPEHLIFFRAGVSEGEYKKVAYWEGGAIKRALSELANEGMSARPSHTIIVCQRASNYRMVPDPVQQGPPPVQNCPPGTVLDRTWMHSSLTEFLIIGHRTIQGTAQPLRCTVVLDKQPGKARMPLAELEHITNALCYQHGICTSPTAVPGVLYSAKNLAERGRNNWKTHTHEGENIEHFELPQQGLSADEQQQQQTQLDNAREAHFVELTETLHPQIQTKFWA